MQIKTSAARPRAHSPLLIGLTALVGFVAGACLVGLAKFPSSSMLKTAETESKAPSPVMPAALASV
jgi:hypothetical protein